MNKVITGIGVLALVAVATFGMTQAFFMSDAEANGVTINSGDLDLLLNLDAIGSGWSNSFSPSETPGYGDLSPGGDTANFSAQLKNDGSTDAAAIGVAVDHTTNQSGIASQMRITELTWKGENLLEGGAGADVSDYESPSTCDITVDNTQSIQVDGIDNANSGDVVCVESGTYNNSTRITIDTDNITLASVAGANSTTIETTDKVGVMIESSGVTVRGFTVTVNDTDDVDTYGEYGVRLEPSGAVQDILIEDNIVEDIEDNYRPSGISLDMKNSGGATATDVTVRNNIIRNITSAVNTSQESVAKAINPNERFDNLVIENNTIHTIGGPNSAGATAIDFSSDTSGSTNFGPENFTIVRNDIDGISIGNKGSAVWKDELAFYLHDYGTLGSHDVSENNFRDGRVLYNTETVGGTPDTLDVTNNWWGDFDPTDQIDMNSNTGDVDYTPIAGGPFVGFVNGTDNNSNGFADLRDLELSPITNATPGLDAGETGQLDFYVQLDGPTTGNSFQNKSLVSDFTYTLGQVVN